MSRRPAPAEQQFGSDSFLDVVANVVGILIILMVLAGLRAAKAPIVLKSEVAQAQNPPTRSEPAQFVPPVAIAPAPIDEAAEERREKLAQLHSQAAELREQLGGLQQQADEREMRLSDLQSQDAALRNRLTSLASNLETELLSAEQLRQQADELAAAAQAVRVKLTKREADLAAAEQTPHKTERLQHRITPVSRVLTENETELHFRCVGGKVAVIPLEDLIGRMKAQMERQRDFIMRSRRYAGSVGPVKGFSLNYVVERENSSSLDSIRAGMNYVRIIVSQWELVPEGDLEAEDSVTANREESNFRSELRKAEPGSTITIWVYPDSYALYRQLQAIAHRDGFTVAARPMPAGIAIMGSPKGSRSSAQ